MANFVRQPARRASTAKKRPRFDKGHEDVGDADNNGNGDDDAGSISNFDVGNVRNMFSCANLARKVKQHNMTTICVDVLEDIFVLSECRFHTRTLIVPWG